jgi:hypothetical protein
MEMCRNTLKGAIWLSPSHSLRKPLPCHGDQPMTGGSGGRQSGRSIRTALNHWRSEQFNPDRGWTGLATIAGHV